ncbi:MAG: hypothetical protein KME27_10695 [Lyngbya sp. HA4199-MV5]|nr:hypothetical protein [Lyngbya sp. HA4199-MV5]
MMSLSNIFTLPATEVQIDPPLLETFREEVAAIALQWTDKRLIATMGYLNNLLYCAAKAQGVVSRGFSKLLEIAQSALFRLREQVTVTVPITYSEQFLSQHWSGGTFSRSSLRSIREQLSTVFGLFEYEKLAFCARQAGDRKQRSTYEAFDVAKALLVYEQLERIYCDRGLELSTLGRHQGCFCKLLYEAIFIRSAGFRRGDQSAGSIPPTAEEAAIIRAERTLKTSIDMQSSYNAHCEALKEYRRIGIDRRHPELFEATYLKWQELKHWLANRPGWDFAELPY